MKDLVGEWYDKGVEGPNKSEGQIESLTIFDVMFKIKSWNHAEGGGVITSRTIHHIHCLIIDYLVK